MEVPLWNIAADSGGVGDRSDAFPLDSTEVVDTDFDGIGNNADTDDDGDGVPDNSDALPLDPTETMDTDLDGIGDNTDAFPSNSLYASDSDLDGMPNAWEVRFGLDPYDPSDFISDQDKDGVSAYDEFIAGTIPAGSLDIDGNGQYDALTDGLLLLRGMFGLSEGALISRAVASDAAYTSSSEIVSRIDMLGDLVDIDGNGRADALTDGLIILRYQLVLNSLLQAQLVDIKQSDSDFVFPGKDGKKRYRVLTTNWKTARNRAADEYEELTGKPADWGFRNLRVHDLRHTFATRLRRLGVSNETRKDLLGHVNTDITTHYSAGELKELLEAVERLVESDKLPPTKPENKGKVLQFPYNGSKESSRKVAK